MTFFSVFYAKDGLFACVYLIYTYRYIRCLFIYIMFELTQESCSQTSFIMKSLFVTSGAKVVKECVEGAIL